MLRLLLLRTDGRHERRPRQEVDTAEQDDQREALEWSPCAGGLEVVTEEPDPDQQRDERVDDHEGRLRRRDRPGVERVLGEEDPEQPRHRHAPYLPAAETGCTTCTPICSVTSLANAAVNA